MSDNNEPLFFVDTKGDPELATEPPPPPPAVKPSVLEHQKDFLPLRNTSPGQSNSNSKKGKGKGKKGNVNPNQKSYTNRDEDYELLVDYIANANLDEFKLLERKDLASILSIADNNSDGDSFEYIDDDKPFSDDLSYHSSEDGEGVGKSALTDSDESILEGERFLAERMQTHRDPGLKDMTLGPKMSKSQRKKLLKEAQKDKIRGKRAARQERATQSSELAKILSRAKEYKDPAVLKYLKKENERLKDFVLDPQFLLGDALVLPPVPGPIRKILYTIAEAYNLNHRTQGKKRERATILYKNGKSSVPHNWSSLVDDTLAKGGSNGRSRGTSTPLKKQIYRDWNRPSPKSKNDGKKPTKIGVSGASKSTPKMGDIVGGNAKPVSESNIGHKLLLSMGWKPGESLGDGTSGLKEPVQVTIRSKRGGLGTE